MRKQNQTIQQIHRLKELRRAILDGHSVVSSLSDHVRLRANELQKESILVAYHLREVRQITGRQFRQWLQREIHCSKVRPEQVTRYIRLLRNKCDTQQCVAINN
jgi:hypothetical protein